MPETNSKDMIDHQMTEAEIEGAVTGVLRLIEKKLIENPSDRKFAIQAVDDWRFRREFFPSTLVWFKSLMARGGKRHQSQKLSI